jgi:hypothetical protein
MGLTERHWFENEDVPENYEWDLEDAVYNSRTNKKHDDDIVRCKDCKWRNTNACFCKSKDDVQDDWYCSEGQRKR